LGDRAPVLGLGLRPLSLVLRLDQGYVSMRFRQTRIELERGLGGGLGLGHRVGWCQIDARGIVVTGSQAGGGQGISRIHVDRLLQVLDALLKALARIFVRVIATLEIKLVGLRVIGVVLGYALGVRPAELGTKLL